MRDRVAWAGGCSLNCGSDWEEDLDMFSRPCSVGGGMPGCWVAGYTGVVYGEQAAEGAVMCSLYPGGALSTSWVSRPLRAKKDKGQNCSIAAVSKNTGRVRGASGRCAWQSMHWLQQGSKLAALFTPAMHTVGLPPPASYHPPRPASVHAKG